MRPSDAYIARTNRTWLYNIVAIKNIDSIMQLGVLSHNRAQKVPHYDISLQDVQDIRANVVVDVNGVGFKIFTSLNTLQDASVVSGEKAQCLKNATTTAPGPAWVPITLPKVV